MVALLQAVWYALVHAVIALPWAVEPWALIEPCAQEIALDGPLLAPPPPPEDELLLSEPHAASASVAVTARQARMPCRWSFTWCPFEVSQLSAGLGAPVGARLSRPLNRTLGGRGSRRSRRE